MITIFRSSLLLVACLAIMTLFSEKIDNLIAYKPVIYTKAVIENKNQNSIYANRPFKKYLNSIAKVESNNNPRIVNPYGYLGKYQFHPLTIKQLGYNITTEQFLNDSRLQDRVMVKYLKNNKRDLRKYIKKYEGTYINDIEITESGILAGAHLGGSGNVILYLESNGIRDKKDANGTGISYYMKKFGGHNVSILEKI